ncbi:MAG: tetratricopeptide repeat protein [Bacteroidetes bacterium]|nr:tetratricopeptide repeat protein [Bacteroidota bacterium]
MQKCFLNPGMWRMLYCSITIAKLKPKDVKAYINFSSFLYSNKKHSESLAIANKILELDSKNISGLKIKAYCQYEMENNIEAISSFNNYMTLSDTSKIDSKDYEYLGKLHQKSGNDSLATINFLLAAKTKGVRPEFFSETMSYFSKKGKYEEVITIYTLKDSLYKPTSADSYQCGRALLAIKEYEAADSLFRRVCELQPSWPNGFLMRGNANANLDPGSKAGKAKPFYEQYLVLAGN